MRVEGAITSKLISAGVRNLRTFGYPDANVDNILIDPIYREFFVTMLKDNLGLGFDKEINQLLSQADQSK